MELSRESKINVLGRFLISQKNGDLLEKFLNIILYKDSEKREIEKVFTVYYKNTYKEILENIKDEYKNRYAVKKGFIDLPINKNLDTAVYGMFYTEDFQDELACLDYGYYSKEDKKNAKKFLEDLKTAYPDIQKFYTNDEQIFKELNNHESVEKIIVTYTSRDGTIWEDNRSTYYSVVYREESDESYEAYEYGACYNDEDYY